jgi:hypothetical protein
MLIANLPAVEKACTLTAHENGPTQLMTLSVALVACGDDGKAHVHTFDVSALAMQHTHATASTWYTCGHETLVQRSGFA